MEQKTIWPMHLKQPRTSESLPSRGTLERVGQARCWMERNVEIISAGLISMCWMKLGDMDLIEGSNITCDPRCP